MDTGKMSLCLMLYGMVSKCLEWSPKYLGLHPRLVRTHSWELLTLRQ